MAFNLSTAKPEQGPQVAGGFNLSTAKPEQAEQPQRDPLSNLQDLLVRQAKGEQGLGGEIQQLRALTNQPDSGEGFSTDVSVGAQLQNIAAIGAGAALEPVAGIAGIVQAVNPFAEEGAGARAVEAVKGLAFQPKGFEAQQLQKAIGETVAPIAEPIEKARTFLKETTGEATGSPLAVSIAATIPEALLSLLPASGAFKSVSKGLTKSGKQALTKASEGLSSGAKRTVSRIIGDTAENKRQFLASEIKAGSGNTDVVALMLNESGDLITNKAAKQAVKILGDDIESLKTASLVSSMSPASKAGVNKMLDIVAGSRKSARFADANRIESVVGDAIGQRARAIVSINQTAGKNIGRIATGLKNKPVNIDKASDTFFNKMDETGVKFFENDAGRLTPDFDNAKFVGGGKDQIEKIANFLQDSKGMGFKDAHELKQFIREGVSFGKGTESALSNKSAGILKETSADIADILGKESNAYRLANKKFSDTIEIKNALDDLAGKDIDLFGDASGSALGLKARRILSNATSGDKINQTLANADKVLKDLGITFKNDVGDLNSISIRLLDNFKLEKQASFAGRLEASAGNAALGGGVSSGVLSSGLDLIKKIREPDFNKKMKAFRLLTKESKK